jgi:hypothetical protein
MIFIGMLRTQLNSGRQSLKSFRKSEVIYFPLYFVLLLSIVFPVNCFQEWNTVVLFYTSVESEKRMKYKTGGETIAVCQTKDFQTSMATTRRLGIVVKCL